MWQNKLTKRGIVKTIMGETTPFVFKGRLYRLENWQKFMEIPGATVSDRFMEDVVRIWDVEADQLVSVALTGYSFATAFVWRNQVYVYAAKHRPGEKWRTVKEVVFTTSEDLRHWSSPETILEAEEGEHLFNVAVCRGPERFVLLYETDDKQWPPFTFKYCESADLRTWTRIPGALYGIEKYVGGPALYFEGDWYYTLYLESLGGAYETRIARSRDLIHWEDAPAERPFLTFEKGRTYTYWHNGEQRTVEEINASDAELCAWQGKTLVYFNGGDQLSAGDLQQADFDGSPRELLESFFEEPEVLVPSPSQKAFQERQLGAFVHFGMATWYDGPEKASFPAVLRDPYTFDLGLWGAMTAQPQPAVFNPQELDAAQWAATAKAMGAQYVILTAKHHNGFCLWPTQTTDYCVRNSPWRGGRGDVVREFAEAVRQAGLAVGLYISAGDVNQGCISTPEPQGQRGQVGNVSGYYPVFEAQFREILSGYGELCEIWLDGALDPFSPDVRDASGAAVGAAYWGPLMAMARELQPDAVVMGGSEPDIRWAGNEAGIAPYPLWNIVSPGEEKANWVPEGVNGWLPAEADVFTRPTWFWTPNSDEAIMPLERLRDIYERSIGHGANLLLNMTPDRRGLIPDAEVRRLAELGHDVKERFGKPLASTNSDGLWCEGSVLRLTWDAPACVTHAILEEDLRYGQRVARYRIEALDGRNWEPLAEGATIGRCRIQPLKPALTQALRLRILESAPLPELRRFEVFANDSVD